MGFIYILIAVCSVEALVYCTHVNGEGAVALSNHGSTRHQEDIAIRPQSEKRIDVWRGEPQHDCQRYRSERHCLDGSQ